MKRSQIALGDEDNGRKKRPNLTEAVRDDSVHHGGLLFNSAGRHDDDKYRANDFGMAIDQVATTLACHDFNYLQTAASTNSNDADAAKDLSKDDDDGDDEFYRRFYTAPPVSDKDLQDMVPAITASLITAMDEIEQEGLGKTHKKMKQQQKERAASMMAAPSPQQTQFAKQAKVIGDAWPHQLAYLEFCKNQNTIVHLGTGRGKTRIAWELIDHLASDFKRGKHTLFVVPTRELASQQTCVLQANLPNYSVAKVHGKSFKNEETRVKLTKINVLVGTYGAMLELFTQYHDNFRMQRVNLLVVDECHHATGDSDCAKLMDIYHLVAIEQRPRVIGLTATPLVKFKTDTPEHVLKERLTELEQTLDAKLPSPADVGIDIDLLRNEGQEITVPFCDASTTFAPLPAVNYCTIHSCRHVEFQQIEVVYQDLGPLAVGLFVQSVVLRRNEYEAETTLQFQQAKAHLGQIYKHCALECANPQVSDWGRADKLVALEELLASELQDPAAAGIVFTANALSATILNHYFRCRRADAKEGKTDIRFFPSSDVIMAEHADHCRNDGVKMVAAASTTKLVEEGIDVPACSFVAAFEDSSAIAKSFVQIKGPPHHYRSKVFRFDIRTGDSATTEESLVNTYLSKQVSALTPNKKERYTVTKFDRYEEELQAVILGQYQTSHRHVNLNSVLSLVHRFALSRSIDSFVRCSSKAMEPYMPRYDEDAGTLYLSFGQYPNINDILVLPPQYETKCQADRKAILALMACVRLHRSGLLTDRLFPVTARALKSKVSNHCEAIIADSMVLERHADVAPSPRVALRPVKDVFVYRINTTSNVFENYRRILGSHRIGLAVVSEKPLCSVPRFVLSHRKFGNVSCSIAEIASKAACNRDELRIISDFFVLLMNNRWKKKQSDKMFRLSTAISGLDSSEEYLVGCIDSEDNLMVEYMQGVFKDSSRSEQERTQAVLGAAACELAVPRLWSPIYNPRAVYISLGASGQNCKASFANKTLENVKTYQDYYRVKYGLMLPEDCHMFNAQSLWDFPAGTKIAAEDSNNGEIRKAPAVPIRSTHKLIDGLPLLLPHNAMAEAIMPDAGLLLLATFLPQTIYQLERYLRAQSFIDYCRTRIPLLCFILSSIDLEEVVTILTAKSARASTNYEMYEWLGDAVLKMVQSDVIVKSTELREWVPRLQEGFLSKTRSALGCNKRLKEVAEALGIRRFIMTCVLAPGKWSPSPLVFSSTTTDVAMTRSAADGKTCADVVEALLGLVFVSAGYTSALQVAEELQCTIPWDDDIVDSEWSHTFGSKLHWAAKSFTGYAFRSNSKLLEEAMTHPTDTSSNAASYQRLEWIGDAVVCLCARMFLFSTFRSSASLGELVAAEASIVCNESLALLAFKNNLHIHLRHQDLTLQDRIDAYAVSIYHLQRGLWGTEPPKALADITESILGAVHLDGGFDAGQAAARRVLEPVLKLLTTSIEQKKTVFFQHPMRMLQEKCGQLFTFNTVPSDTSEGTLQTADLAFSIKAKRITISAKFMTKTISNLSDFSKASGTNRFAYLLLATLNATQNAELCKRVKKFLLVVQKAGPKDCNKPCQSDNQARTESKS